jgi:5-methylthioadenosine/S-adenosylhomocysteine deaminase
VEKDLLIIAGGLVLTCDPASHAGRFDLLVRNGRISTVAPPGTLVRQHADAQVIDATDKLIIPGLVNAHFHPESLLLRPLTAGVHFGLWAQDVSIRTALAQLLQPESHDDVRSLTLAGVFAHVKSGTVAVAHFPPAFDGEALQILGQSAARADLSSVQVLQTWQQIDRARGGLDGVRGYFVGIGEEQDLTVYNLGTLVRTSKEMQIPLLAHIGERREDEETVRRNFQKNVGSVLRDIGALQPETVLVHCNHLQEQDLELIEAADATIVVCARSAGFKQTGYPLLRLLMAHNIRLAVGSDWAQTDMLEELRFLAQLPRLVSGMPAFSPLELVRMATINGAVALGLGAELGSIEAGKRADLVFLSLRDLRLPPLTGTPSPREIAEYVVTAANAQQISEVMINGEFAYGGGQLTTITEDDVLAGFRATLGKWYAATPPMEEPPATPPAEGEGVHQAKILPFVAREPLEAPDEEGFEEGFTVIGPRPGVPRIPQTGPPREQPSVPNADGEERQPELPKDVRREFGDDEAS